MRSNTPNHFAWIPNLALGFMPCEKERMRASLDGGNRAVINGARKTFLISTGYIGQFLSEGSGRVGGVIGIEVHEK